ncbi:AAA family ATPase [Pseudomonas sp. KCJK8927]|uniref:trifunctional serine/threonine-protein kinase/ATP-binding protein/sensor histidine kinase n=1 Tax=Pseudomonas sp. KCJK8927 TaxID=3344560 RepID=UPI00390656B5
MEHDLLFCLEQWLNNGCIVNFEINKLSKQHSISTSKKMYGREEPYDQLLRIFEKSKNMSQAEVVLISGESGVGKSTLVSNFEHSVRSRMGRFAVGKFDLLRQNTPYSALVDALRDLMRTQISNDECDKNIWTTKFYEALAPNEKLLTRLIPELQILLGDRPDIIDLSPIQNRKRFIRTFCRFISAFELPNSPVVLFIDDLQWADQGTIELFTEIILTKPIKNLVLIGAYRSDEVGTSHPLKVALDKLGVLGVKINSICLQPLSTDQVSEFLADSLGAKKTEVTALAGLVKTRTHGNPFFINQFIRSMAEERSLSFNTSLSEWQWKDYETHFSNYSEDVLSILLNKLQKLPTQTLEIIKTLSCIGSSADITSLSIATALPNKAVEFSLHAAVQMELVVQADYFYRFTHDQIQKAVYALIPQERIAITHLRIGRRLLAAADRLSRQDQYFKTVGQLNRGSQLISARSERMRLAQLNYSAGLRAKVSSDYTSALTYFTSGLDLIPEDKLSRKQKGVRQLLFDLHLNCAECELLTGALEDSEHRLRMLARSATTVLERAKVTCLLMDVYLILDRSEAAVAICLDYLRYAGIAWAAHPSEDDVRLEYGRIVEIINCRSVQDLETIPMMQDPVTIATTNTLCKLFAPALQSEPTLTDYLICKAVRMSLEYGNTAASCVLYANFFRVAGRRFGNLDLGFQISKLGCVLVEKYGLTDYEPSTYLCFSCFTARWMRPVQECLQLLRRSFEAAKRVGDIAYGAYAGNNLVSDLLFSGQFLSEVMEEAVRGLDYAKKVGFGLVVYFIRTQLMLLHSLRIESNCMERLDDDVDSEEDFQKLLASQPDLVLAETLYWIRKLQVAFLSGRHEIAHNAAAFARRNLWVCESFSEEAEYYFYYALNLASRYKYIKPNDQSFIISELEQTSRILAQWADQCPSNFSSRFLLVSAEFARVEQRHLDAERFYNLAIDHSRSVGFLNIEALANELAAVYYKERGLMRISSIHFRDAIRAYRRWGAEGKAKRLEVEAGNLKKSEPRSLSGTGAPEPLASLELSSLLVLAHEFSQEISLSKLLCLVLTRLIQQTKADVGLIRLTEETSTITSCISSQNEFTFEKILPMNCSFPNGIFDQVLKSRHQVLLNNVRASDFSNNLYISEKNTKAILCLPLLNQAKLVGAVYLESRKDLFSFSNQDASVANMIATLAAGSLENAGLYSQLEKREAKFRRLVDSNIIGIVRWDANGNILEANEAFLTMVRYTRAELDVGLVRWRDLTPVKYLEITERSLQEALATGRALPYEKEYIRSDGTLVPVVVGLVSLNADAGHGVAFVLDLTEQKHAEQRIRDSERRFVEIQADLAHANRVATMGQLVTSISHDVNQPITEVILNAEAAAHLLNSAPEEIMELKIILDRVIHYASQAADVLTRVRSHIRKTTSSREPFNLNAAIIDIVQFANSQITKSSTCFTADLDPDLPPVVGNRVEIQQVLLNLILHAIEAMEIVDKDKRKLFIKSTIQTSGLVEIHVRDSGPGFNSPDMGASQFYITKSTDLGLGLSICKSIVEGHGGDFSTSNDKSGGGVVVFTLPSTPI